MNAVIKIGPTFVDELGAAGLLGLPFSWSDDGKIIYSPEMTTEQIDGVRVVLAAHDPTTPSPPFVPESVTKYQCCVVLARHSLLAPTNSFFAGMATDDLRRLAWEMAATVQRHSESTLDAIAHLGLSEALADAMFIEAAQVE